MKDGLPDVSPPGFCMKKDENNQWELQREHAYYYQVQVQLNVCNLSSGDFVLWTENGLAMERILRDPTFYAELIGRVEHFFIYGILPEIVGKCYTRKPIANEAGVVCVPQTTESTTHEDKEVDDETDHEKSWCFCGEPGFGEMIMCDNPQCTLTWFHFECLRLQRAPKGKWYCPSCCKLPQFSCSKKIKW